MINSKTYMIRATAKTNGGFTWLAMWNGTEFTSYYNQVRVFLDLNDAVAQYDVIAAASANMNVELVEIASKTVVKSIRNDLDVPMYCGKPVADFSTVNAAYVDDGYDC